MKFIGIDFSLTSPAITILASPTEHTFFYRCASKKSANYKGEHHLYGEMHTQYSSFEERIDQITEWALKVIMPHPDAAITIEDYAYGASGKVFHIAENVGLLKHKLYKAKRAFTLASPASIKKLATGKGNATKMMMEDAFRTKTNLDLHAILGTQSDSPISDIVDSYYTALYGIHGNMHTTQMVQTKA